MPQFSGIGDDDQVPVFDAQLFGALEGQRDLAHAAAGGHDEVVLKPAGVP
jgi:hypothetical protein